MENLVTITPKAVDHIAKIFSENNSGSAQGLRLGVIGGGCSGLSYKIDFGEKIGKKISSAQITNYTIDELINRQIVAVCNFEKKNIAGVESEVLVLGAINEQNEVILLKPDIKVKNGSIIS